MCGSFLPVLIPSSRLHVPAQQEYLFRPRLFRMARRECSFGAISVERFESRRNRVGDPSLQSQPGPGRLVSFSWAANSIARSTLAFLNCTLCLLCFGSDLNVRTPRPPIQVPEIPFQLYQGYVIVVEGRVGGLEHQHLLFDTGTSPSMIDRSVSAKLRLQSTPRGLALFNKTLASESVTLPDLQLGPLRRKNLRVMVADFSGIGSGLGTRIDAVIGLDVMDGRSFTVDYAKHRIFFGASAEPHTVPLIAGPQFITVSLKTGSRQLHLLVDTGTPQLVLFQSHLHHVDYEWSAVIGSGRNISGDVAFGTIILPQARIGEHELGPQRASVVTTRRDVEGDFDGLIGISCLRPKRVSFDFERQLLGWSD